MVSESGTKWNQSMVPVSKDGNGMKKIGRKYFEQPPTFKILPTGQPNMTTHRDPYC